MKAESELKKWKPNLKQEAFIRIPFSVFEGFYGGAVFGGKSNLLRMLPLIYGFHNNPSFSGILFRRTFPELEESHIDNCLKEGFYEAAGGKYNSQKHVWRFPSGATMRFAYCEEDKDARSHDTSEFHLMMFDELTHFTRYQYEYLTSRVRTSTKDLPAIVRSASMPGNLGHAWVRDRFIEPAPEGYKLIKDKFTQTSRIFIPARLQDNIVGLEANPSYVTQLNILPEGERKAKVDGDWYVFSGQVFTEFRDVRLKSEPENAIHVIEDFKIPDWWPKILSIDWGYVHPTYACWAALSPDKKVYIYREYWAEKTKIATWAADIARISQMDENIVAVKIDPSALADRGQPQTIAAQFMEVSGMYCEPADNDRIGGKLLYHDFLRWKPRPAKYIPKEGYDPDKAERIYRLHGEKAKDDYIQAFLPEKEETNLPKLQIFSSCPVLIRTIKLCVYDDKKKDKPGVIAEDVAKFNGDDAYDASRYLLKEVDKYWYGLDLEYKRVQERQRILDRRAETGNETSFYMQMEAFEKRDRLAVRPVRRFH